MATPNYGYEKRQRELAKKRKAEEKKQKKSQGGGVAGSDDQSDSAPDADRPTGTDTPPPAAG